MTRPARAATLATLAVALIVAPAAVAKRKQAAPGPDPRVYAALADGERVYLARTGDVLVVSLAEPAAPRELATIALPFSPRRLALDGSRLIAAGDTHGVAVVDVTDPAAPSLETHHDPYARIRHALPLADRHLVLAAHRDGLHVLDVSEPDRPRRVARVGTRGEVVALALDGTRLATAEEQGGVRLFEIGRPRRPRELRHWWREAAGAVDVALVGERLWVAAGRRGVLVFDTTRADERPLHEIAVRRGAFGLDRRGEQMLVRTRSGALLLSTDDPEAGARPVELPRRPAIGDAVLAGELAILALDGGWAVVDVSAGTEPSVIWPGGRRRMRISWD